jgi:lipoic acid synthetase
MILGDICTRRCGFCNIEGGNFPSDIDMDEPVNIAITVKEMGLKHVVITAVTRDDLADGGAAQFALTIQAIRDSMPAIFVEVLTPDFRGERGALGTVLKAGPDIFNHNVETVPSLYSTVRPQASYERSLGLLETAKRWGLTVKSGIMLGLGEKRREVLGVMEDMLSVGCDALTIGQYLQPNRGCLEVMEYVEPERFKEFEELGKSMGFKYVLSGPFVRSSYNAEYQLAAKETVGRN